MVSFYTKFELWRTHSFGDIHVGLAFVTKASSVSMQFYSCVSIILHTYVASFVRLRVAVLEDLQKEGGARRSRTSNRMLAVARARVQGNGNNIIVLINRDTASVLFMPIVGEDQRGFLFELKTLILPRKKSR